MAVIDAARALLDRIDNITTDEFSRGGEMDEREALRKAFANRSAFAPRRISA